MKTSHLVLALAIAVSQVGGAQQARVSVSRQAAQVAAGTLAIPVGLALGVAIPALTIPSESEMGEAPKIIGAIVGGVVGLTITPTLAVRAIGTGGAPHGNGGDAFTGVMVGYGADLALGGLLSATPLGHSENGVARVAVFAAALVIPAVGGTLAYDHAHR